MVAGLLSAYNSSVTITHHIHLADSRELLPTLPDGIARLIYIDPPFNTGRAQRRTTLKTRCAARGDRTGFAGKSYVTETIASRQFADSFDDYLAFIAPLLEQARRLLTPDGTLYFHIDYREVHYCKVLLDRIFGRASFLNEVIWAYDYGARTKSRWPAKHDNILVYVKNPEDYVFNYDALDRIPYLAPELVGPEKAARGKTPTDTWWHTIVPTNSKEKTGYPTQKPLGILCRILRASSDPGDTVLDFFAGSGTTGAACLELGRRFLLVDKSDAALAVMAKRFRGVPGIRWHGYAPDYGADKRTLNG